MHVDYDITEITIYMDNGHEYTFGVFDENWDTLKNFLSYGFFGDGRSSEFSWDEGGSTFTIIGNHITDVKMKR